MDCESGKINCSVTERSVCLHNTHRPPSPQLPAWSIMTRMVKYHPPSTPYIVHGIGEHSLPQSSRQDRSCGIACCSLIACRLVSLTELPMQAASSFGLTLHNQCTRLRCAEPKTIVPAMLVTHLSAFWSTGATRMPLLPFL